MQPNFGVLVYPVRVLVMKQSFRVSLGAVILALATLAAVVFALLNFDQRVRYELPDDAVAWRDTDHGVEAWKVSPTGPAAQAGIRAGDVLLEINGQPVTRAGCRTALDRATAPRAPGISLWKLWTAA